MRFGLRHCLADNLAKFTYQRLTSPVIARSIRKHKQKAYTRPSRCDAAQRNQNLSSLITFETEGTDDAKQSNLDTEKDDVIQSATAALKAARAALRRNQAQRPSRPDSSRVTSSRSEAHQISDDKTRASLDAALGRYGQSQDWADQEGSQPISTSSIDQEKPSWVLESLNRSRDSSEPQLQRAATPSRQTARPVLDRVFTPLSLEFESAVDAERARTATLPPLQSVLDLTSAAAPPSRSTQQTASPVSSAGRQLEDGAGQLADGTQYERTTTEEFGADGYWLRQTVMRGISAQGEVEWEERWWEASDWAGMRELGAEKSGCAVDGSAWRETWREAISFDPTSKEPIVERSAHKWAQDARGDAWEEKWGEHYAASGSANKYADKWGKDGPNVWHERWGEDYNGRGACVKYTDKWAERLLEGGGNEQWGEKWVEDFAGGSGKKDGETWTVDGGGQRYQRWWGEEHFGNGWVRLHGNSTTGEHWDHSQQMDTYYNPIPHFTYKMALDHSPTLQKVPVLPRGNLDGDLEDGGAAAL